MTVFLKPFYIHNLLTYDLVEKSVGNYSHRLLWHVLAKYLIGPCSAGPFLTPALIPPFLKMRLTPIRAGVKRATNSTKSGVERYAFLGRPI